MAPNMYLLRICGAALTHDLVIRAESDPVTDSDPFVDELDVTIRVVPTGKPQALTTRLYISVRETTLERQAVSHTGKAARCIQLLYDPSYRSYIPLSQSATPLA